MKAPKGRTNMRSRRVSTWLSPFQEEWVRAQAAATYPPDESVMGVINGPVSRFLRQLVDEAMDADPLLTPWKRSGPRTTNSGAA